MSNLPEDAVRICLTIGDHVVPATLEDNQAARDLLAQRPITVHMHDLFAREKPGRLPGALSTDVEPVLAYRVGQIAYWPPNQDIALFYAHDGARIPSPGLIPLGQVEKRLEVIAGAGDAFDMTIDTLDRQEPS